MQRAVWSTYSFLHHHLPLPKQCCTCLFCVGGHAFSRRHWSQSMHSRHFSSGSSNGTPPLPMCQSTSDRVIRTLENKKRRSSPFDKLKKKKSTFDGDRFVCQTDWLFADIHTQWIVIVRTTHTHTCVSADVRWSSPLQKWEHKSVFLSVEHTQRQTLMRMALMTGHCYRTANIRTSKVWESFWTILENKCTKKGVKKAGAKCSRWWCSAVVKCVCANGKQIYN